MRHVFGPVPSRRLGRSLGVDPVPLKTCNWHCVYRQLGRTAPLVQERREWIPREEILLDLEAALAAHGPGEIDWVTFVGSGETALHLGLGWMLERTRRSTSLPLAVINNGSPLYMPEVPEELARADAALPSLDAGEARLFRRINQPHPQSTFERLAEGLIEFRRMYRGRLWVEVMLVRGLNDDEVSLHSLASALEQVEADAVHINCPSRPPAEPWVKPPDHEGLIRAVAILGRSAELVQPAEGSFEIRDEGDVVHAILEVITRHPMRLDELRAALRHRMSRGGHSPSEPELDQVIACLDASGEARRVIRHGTVFWTAAGSGFTERRTG